MSNNLDSNKQSLNLYMTVTVSCIKTIFY